MGACLQLSGAEMRAIGGDPFNMTVAGLRLARARQRGRRSCTARPRARCGRTSATRRRSSRSRTACTRRPGSPSAVARRAATPSALWDGARGAQAASCSTEIARAQRRAARSRRAAHRLRAPRRRLQAQRPDPARRGAARRSCSASTACTLRVRGQGAPRRPRAARRSWRGWCTAARSASRARSCSSRTTTWRWRALLTRGCDVWLNNPVRPLEASGTLGHEGRDERRAQPEHPRRLVARGLRARRERLGDRRRARRATTRATSSALYATLEGDVLPAWKDRARWLAHDARQHPMGMEQLLLGPHGARVLREALLDRADGQRMSPLALIGRVALGIRHAPTPITWSRSAAITARTRRCCRRMARRVGPRPHAHAVRGGRRSSCST